MQYFLIVNFLMSSQLNFLRYYQVSPAIYNLYAQLPPMCRPYALVLQDAETII
jgi:hypothetical protein